jgi:hypothetical protein
MEEAHAVLERLSRINALERAGASPRELLGELRELVREAEAWSGREGDERAQHAVDRCRAALEGSVTASR